MKPVFDIRRNLCSRLSGRASARAISNADVIRPKRTQLSQHRIKRFLRGPCLFGRKHLNGKNTGLLLKHFMNKHIRSPLYCKAGILPSNMPDMPVEKAQKPPKPHGRARHKNIISERFADVKFFLTNMPTLFIWPLTCGRNLLYDKKAAEPAACLLLWRNRQTQGT